MPEPNVGTNSWTQFAFRPHHAKKITPDHPMSAHMKNKKMQLSNLISLDDFKNFYWLKKELQQFCREHGLSTTGGKQELQKRIEQFLQTGEVQHVAKRNELPRVRLGKDKLSMSTVIPKGFTCTREARDFLIAHAGKDFKYSVALQRYLKANPGITFLDLIEEWKRQKKSRAKEPIGEQFEYNQFTRDFFADPKNKGKSRENCIAAWYMVRNSRGPRKYKPKD